MDCRKMLAGVMAVLGLGLAATLTGQSLGPAQVDDFAGHPRVIVISDIGNEPDDQMSLVRLLLYSNELEIEGMIAATSTWQRTAIHPETMRKLIEAYGEARPNLLLNAQGWPEAQEFLDRVYAGQPGYGMASTGEGKASEDSEGARAIVRALERDDSRPLWVCIWGGANTLSQALMDLRASKPPAEAARLVSKLRVYSISDQDDAGAWMRREFPGLFYIVMPSTQDGNEYYFATWTGISSDAYYSKDVGADPSTVTNAWLDENIRSKGPLGKVYPRVAYIMEGDTPSYLNLIDNGLNAYRRPDWGGWGGRYVYRQPHGETHPFWSQGGSELGHGNSQDTVIGADGQEHTSDQATVWRWRRAYQYDFAARMTWTVADFAHSSHRPLVVVNGSAGTAPVEIDLAAGQSLTLDAGQSTNPDGQQLHFHWFHYAEAGTADGNLAGVTLTDAETSRAIVRAENVCGPAGLWPTPCKGTGVAHIILAVTGEGRLPLTAYRRIILRVHPAADAGQPITKQ